MLSDPDASVAIDASVDPPDAPPPDATPPDASPPDAPPPDELVPCLLGGSVVYFDGDTSDFIHPGMDTITDAGFTATTRTGDPPARVQVRVVPNLPNQGSSWTLTFSSERLNESLMLQQYDNAMREPFADPGRPGLSVTGDGRGCNRLSGSFFIHELDMVGGALQRFAASYVQHCEEGAAALRGCVVYAP